MSSSVSFQTFLLAGELAGRAGVSTDTLRHYERKGVLPRPRRGPNGYRQYPQASLERVLMVRQALAVGFTLDELAQIFAERDRGGTPCRKVRALVDDKLADVEKHLATLTRVREELHRIGRDWDKRLAGTEIIEGRYHLLENLRGGDLNFEAETLPLKFKINKRK